ncbi:MAG: PAS domain S-box protein [Acidobacteria bacterium]|nr:PAS domain S-box protein [Acidobacteriota bacterium]
MEARATGRRISRRLVFLLYVLALVPMVLSAGRKLSTFGRADVLVQRQDVIPGRVPSLVVSSGSPGSYLVLHVGPSALGSGLAQQDVLLAVDGQPALGAGDPADFLASAPHDLILLRGGALVSVTSQPCPSPWSVRYLFLLFVGGAFLTAGFLAAWQSREAVEEPESLVFALFSLAFGLALVLTPVAPVDSIFKTSVLVEDIARALLPAFLLQLVFTFPRRAGRIPIPLFYAPAAALCVLSFQTYLGGHEEAAIAAVRRLDDISALWLSLGALVSAVRLGLLARVKIDLLTEKRVRFLLFGTALGLLPLCLLDFLPHLFFGKALPILSTLGVLPLALLPFAFLLAITRYRLWDVEVLGREATALVVTALLGAGLFTAAQLLLSGAVLSGIPYAKGTLEATAGLLLAVSFVPVKRRVSGVLTRLHYGDGLAEREGLVALLRELPLLRSTEEIEARLLATLSRALGVKPAALLYATADGASLDASRVDGGMPIPCAELPEGLGARKVLTAFRLSRAAFSTLPTAAIARLRRAGFRTLAPLAVSGRLLAVVAVGDRDGRLPLSSEDVELLETLLGPAALALDHARLYDELRAQAERYRVLTEFHEDVVSGSLAAIAATDVEGRFTSVNPAFCALFGKPELALVGTPAESILPAPLLASGNRRFTLDTTRGERILDAAISEFPGAAASSAARVYVFSDVTEQSRLEKSVADHERLAALGSLSAGVAHEVNTPLAGVAGFARLLLDETPEGDPRRRLVEKIERQAFRASRLVGSLLDLARGRPRESSPLDASWLAREAARALEDEAQGRGARLRLELPENALRISGHSDALVQVLVNLVKNGLEAIALAGAARIENPEVRLRVRAGKHLAQPSVLFEVEDDGPGLDEAVRDRIFQPFISTKTSQGGTGLGLAIAHDIVRAHGGSVTVETEKGKGTRFTVALPAIA